MGFAFPYLQSQPQILLYLIPPPLFNTRLIRILPPVRHHLGHFLDDGFGAAALHHRAFGAGAKILHCEAVAFAVEQQVVTL